MASNGGPATPPSDPSTTKPEAPAKADPEVPLTSAQDDGTTKRPRDARLIHVVLSSLGIHSYQERVPLQLLDFAYRYTSGVLNDSLRLSAEGYAQQAGATGGGRRGGGDASENTTVTALRQAIAARQGYTFQGALPKEFMLEQAVERNRIALPKVERAYGVQLPPEKYCLTGVGWGLKDEWESDEEVEVPETAAPMQRSRSAQNEDERMGGMDVDDENEEGAGRMEDVFGEDGGDVTMAQD
jgi:transcription initiation factor TFIID subunit 9B